jgi:glycine/D-amino acid oxidase-like deaminating enzyme
MRILVIGGGLAGAALAWRLSGDDRVARVDLFTGSGRVDASRVSGGVVRSFETHPVQRRLATESLRELRDSPVLRSWAQYAEAESLYVTTRETPESARVLSAGELAARGWSGLPQDVRGVHEPRAGWVDADAFRDALLTDLRSRPAVRTAARDLDAGHQLDRYQAVVVAAGAWTPQVLRQLGVPTGDLMTKAIQYGVYETDGWRPPCFVDETTGLYGRPVGTHQLLLGVPTQRWDVAPDETALDLLVEASALRAAAVRFPTLRLRRRSRLSAATDCYHPEAYLALRPAVGTTGPLFTFTGGSGGSAKTVLAASASAASHLLTSAHPPAQLAIGDRG